MKTVDILFGIGSVAALAAGLSEIHSARDKWLHNEARNALTPFFMMCVKALRIPKFAVLARTGGGADAFPLMSACAAFVIWTIAWYYNIGPSPKHGAASQAASPPAHGATQGLHSPHASHSTTQAVHSPHASHAAPHGQTALRSRTSHGAYASSVA